MNNSKFETDISVVIGKSGSGKTLGVVLPSIKNAILKNESFVVTDAKNQLFKFVANDLDTNNYKTIIFNFRDINKSNTWNPLELPYAYYLKEEYQYSMSLLYDFADELFDFSELKDDFWVATAKDLFVGLSLLLFEDAEKEEINFKSLYYLATRGEEKFAGSTFLKEYIKLRNKDTFNMVSSNVSVAINSPAETRGGIMSTFIQKLRLFERYEMFSETMGHSDFSMTDLYNKKVAIFFQYEDEKNSSNKIVMILLKMIFNMIIKYQTHNQENQKTFNFFLDDFLSLGRLNNIEKYYLCGKNRKIRIQFALNDIYLFKKVYGEEILKSLILTADKIFCMTMSKDDYLDSLSKNIEYYDKINLDNCADSKFSYEHNKYKTYSGDIPFFQFDKIVMDQKRNELYNPMPTVKIPPMDKSVDIDELLKKIDKRIEELEEEEKKEMNQKSWFNFGDFKKK